MSPSPEVDLSSPEFGDDLPMGPPTPAEGFGGRGSRPRDGAVDHRLPNHRAPSPPLEADEKGFTETATAARARAMSWHESVVPDESADPAADEPAEETAEMTRRKDQELGYELFGHSHGALDVPGQRALGITSPMMQARHARAGTDGLPKKGGPVPMDEDVEMAGGAWELDSPEDVELEELDGLFTDF